MALTSVFYPFWNVEATTGAFVRPWSQVAIDIVPSMLGFSMGGMAIMLAFSGEKIFRTIAEAGKPDSIFMQIIANFFHFILMQTFAIGFALFSKSYSSDIISAIGCFFLIYAILVGVATAGQLLQTAVVFNMSASLPEDKGEDDD